MGCGIQPEMLEKGGWTLGSLAPLEPWTLGLVRTRKNVGGVGGVGGVGMSDPTRTNQKTRASRKQPDNEKKKNTS